MVSFFGLKLGGEKKKKSDKVTEAKPAPKKFDQNLLGEGQFFGTNVGSTTLINGSMSRPGTGMSHRSFRRPNAPYLHGTASSMVDLSSGSGHHSNQPSVSSIRYHGSEANLRMRWNNASSTSLVAPLAVGAGSRPGTANSMRTKAWVNPLDVHFCRDGAASPAPSIAANPPVSTTTVAVASAPLGPSPPKSPLGQFEFNLAPLDLSKNKREPAENLTPREGESASPPKSYPSPPQSIKGIDQSAKPAHSNSFRDGRNAQQTTGPASLPSPTASLSRSSEERNIWSGPVIQNVQAKRDTLTFHPPRRQSFSMDIEESDKWGFNFDLDNRPSTSNGGSPPSRSAKRPSPQVNRQDSFDRRDQPRYGSPQQRPPQQQRDQQSRGPVPQGPPLRPPPPHGLAQHRDQRLQDLPPPGPPPRGSPPQEPSHQQRGHPPPHHRGPPPPQGQMQGAARPRPPPLSGFNGEPARMNNDGPTAPMNRTNTPRGDRILPPQNGPNMHFRPPPSARRGPPPGEGERSYGIQPGSKHGAPAPQQLSPQPLQITEQNPAPKTPQFRLPGWEDRDVESKSFAAPRPAQQQGPQPSPTTETGNWPLGPSNGASPLKSPTFGLGNSRPWTPTRGDGMLPHTPLAGGEERRGQRPDFGLRAPTGIADEFRVGFI